MAAQAKVWRTEIGFRFIFNCSCRILPFRLGDHLLIRRRQWTNLVGIAIGCWSAWQSDNLTRIMSCHLKSVPIQAQPRQKWLHTEKETRCCTVPLNSQSGENAHFYSPTFLPRSPNWCWGWPKSVSFWYFLISQFFTISGPSEQIWAPLPYWVPWVILGPLGHSGNIDMLTVVEG